MVVGNVKLILKVNNVTIRLPDTPWGTDMNVASDNPQVVKSPNYPASYPSNLQVTWTVTASEGELIQGVISSFDLVAPNDYLDVYDTNGQSVRRRRAAPEGATLLLHLTGPEASLSNTTFVSSSNAVTLVFVSDAEDEASGFSLVFTAMNNLG